MIGFPDNTPTQEEIEADQEAYEELKKQHTEENTTPLIPSDATGGGISQIEKENDSIAKSTQTNVRKEDFEDYLGDSFNPLVTDIRKARAQEQSGWEQTRRAVGQTGTMLLGDTISGVGYLLDIPDGISDYITGSQEEFGNAISRFGESISEWGRETMPIYEEDPGSFSPGDWGWAMKNVPSIFSTISLAIPAMATTKGLKYFSNAVRGAKDISMLSEGLSLAKGAGKTASTLGELNKARKTLDYGEDVLNSISKLSRAERGNVLLNTLKATDGGKAFTKLQNAARASGLNGEVVANASLSRVAENYMEAIPTAQKVYQDALDNGATKEQANKARAKAFNSSFALNSLFLAQDIFTFKLLGNASKALRGKPLSATGNVTWGKSGIDIAGEGVEEIYQYGVGEESEYYGRLEAGIQEESNFLDRLATYNTGEMWTSGVFGALGAGVFRGLGKYANAYADKKMFENQHERNIEAFVEANDREPNEQEREQIRTRTEKQVARKNADITLNLANANEFISKKMQQVYKAGGDITPYLHQQELNNAISRKVNGGEDYKSVVQELSELSEEEYNDQYEGNPPITKEQNDKIAESIDKVNERFDENVKYGDKAKPLTVDQTNLEYAKQREEQKTEELEEELQSNKSYQRLSNDKARDIVETKMRIKALENSIEKNNKRENKNEDANKYLNDLLDTEKDILKRWENQEKPNDDHKNDKQLLSSLSEDINRLADKQSDIDALRYKIDKLSDRIAKTKEEYSKEQTKSKKDTKEQKTQSYKDIEIGEGFDKVSKKVEDQLKDDDKSSNAIFNDIASDIKDLPPSSKNEIKKAINDKRQDNEERPLSEIFTKKSDKVEDRETSKQVPVESVNDIEAGDNLIIPGMTGHNFTVQEENGNKVVRYPDTGTTVDAQKFFDANNTVYKDISQQELETKSKEDLEEKTEAEKEKIPVEYEGDPESATTDKSKKETIISASWVSIHNETNANPEDSNEIAKSHWAETVDSVINDNDGSYKYNVEFEIEESTDTEYEKIRAYVTHNGERVTQDGIEVFFYVHKPTYEKTQENNSDARRKATEYREEILDALNAGKQPTAPIIKKTGGIFKFGGDIKDLLVITGENSPSDLTLTVLNRQFRYVDSSGTPQQFRRLGQGKPKQVGRVYTTIEGLNGQDKVLPLERKTLTPEMIDTVYSITQAVANGTNIKDTVSDHIWDNLNIGYGNTFKDIFDTRPSYLELLNNITLEGSIYRKDDGKIDKTNNNWEKKFFHINVDEKTIHFGEETVGFDALADKRTEFREFLGGKHINVLKSKLNTPKYNEYLINNEYLYQTNKLTNDENASPLTQPTFNFGNIRVQDESINEELVSEQEQQPPWDVESSKEDIDLDDALMGGMEQRLPVTQTQSLKPVLDGLKRRLGIDYVMFNNPDVEFAGLYENDTAYINTAKAGDDTPFHEYAHPIIRQIKNNSPILYAGLVSQISKDQVYKNIKRDVAKAYPEYSDQQVAEETLVQIIGQKAATNETTQSYIAELWDKIKNYIKSFFTQVDVNKLDENTTLADIADLLSGNQFIDVEMNPMVGYQLKPNDMRFKEWNSWINSMMFMLLNGNNVTDYTQADKINYDVIIDRFYPVKDQVPEINKIFNELFDTETGEVNKDSRWYKALSDKLANFDIKPQQETNGETYNDENSPDFTPDYLFSGKEKTSTFIKMMFSTIPKVSGKRKDGSYIFEKNSITGLREFHSFNDMWNLTNKVLSDTVESFDENGQIEDIFPKFVDKLNNYKELRPEISFIIQRLQDAPQWKKAKFVTTFYQANQNYTLVLYDGKFKVQKNTPTSVEEKVKSQWQQDFKRNWFDKDGNISQKGKDKLLAKYDTFVDNWAEYFADPRKKFGPIENKYRRKFREIFDNIGLSLSDKGLSKLLIDYADENNVSQREALDNYIRNEGLNYILKGRSGLDSISNIEDKNFIENQNISNDIIEAESFFRQDLGTASVFGPGNNSFHTYSNASMIGKLLQYYKENPRMLDELKNIPFYGRDGEIASNWAEHIDKLHITNNFAFKKKGSLGDKMKSVGEIDRLFIDINKALSGQFSMMARGANATEFNITGAPVIKSYIVQDKNISLNNNGLEIIKDYVYDEIERVKAEKEFIDAENQKALEDESYEPKFIDDYHTEVQDPSTGEYYVPATRVFLMPNIFDDLKINEKISRDRFKNGQHADKLNNIIQEAFKERVDDVLTRFENENISRDQANALITDESNDYGTSVPLESKLYDYMFNGMVSNIEQQKLFAADTAMFGTIENMLKRILANGSSGISSYIDANSSEYYNSATIQDIAYDSKVWENYKGVEVTDAQAWVTLPLYIELLDGYGKFGPEQQQSLNAIISGDFTREDMNLFTQSLKTVGFERVSQDGRIIPSYDKQTIFPLIPGLVKDTSLENLLNNMENNTDENGNPAPIDHVAVSSGKKLGRIRPADAIDPETGQFRKNFDLTPIRQSKRFTFLQTEMPTKGIGEGTQGSQQKWNVVADLDPTLEFNGRNAISEVHRIQGAIGDILTGELLDSVTDENGKVDKTKLYNRLISLSKSRNIDRTLIDYLGQEIPIEAIPSHNMSLQYKIMALINGLGASYNFSNQFVGIQTSAAGWGGLTNKDKQQIDWLTDKSEFTPPQLIDGELVGGSILIPHNIVKDYDLDLSKEADKKKALELLDGIGYRIPGQSVSNIAPMQIIGVLPEYMGDTIIPYGEIVDQMGTDNDGDKTYVMLYNLEPENASKLNYWIEEGDNKKATLKEIWKYRKSIGDNVADEKQFIDKYIDRDILTAQSQKQVENYLLDQYQNIFSTEDAFDRMTSKLEDDSFKDLIMAHPEYEERDIKDLEFASPLFQVDMRNSFINANSGVGQDSNAILDHVKSQNKDIYVTDSKGEPYTIDNFKTNTTKKTSNGDPAISMDEAKNVDGKLISNIMSLFMTGHVDAESDDYAPRGNFNTETNNIALAMTRAGASLSDIVDNIGSESVRAYTSIKRRRKNKLINERSDKKIRSVIDQTAIELGYFEEQTDPKTGNVKKIPEVDELMKKEEDLRVYQSFEEISKDVSKSIQLTRFSVNGAGKSFASAVAFELFLDTEFSRLANVENKFSEDKGTPSMEKKSYENTVLLARTIFEDQSIAFGSGFVDVLRTLENTTNFQAINLIAGNTDNAENAYTAYYNYIMSGVFSETNREDLIKGDNTVAQRIRDYSDDNALIKHLIATQTNKGFDFVKTANHTQVDEELSNILTEAWEDLYYEDKQLALDLGKLAYFQSGFKRNMHSTHELIPPIIHEQLDIAKRYSELQTQDDHIGFVDQYIRHNIENDQLVPPVHKSDFKQKGNKYIIDSTDYLDDTDSPMQYLKVRVSGQGPQPSFYRLLEFTDVLEEAAFEYTPTPTLGYNEDGIHFYEYDLDMEQKTPIFSQIPYPSINASLNLSDQQREEISQQEMNKEWKETDNNDDTPFNEKDC